MEEFWLSSTPLSSSSRKREMVKNVSYWTWIKKNVSYKLDLIKCVWKNESVDKQGGADIKAKYGSLHQHSIHTLG